MNKAIILLTLLSAAVFAQQKGSFTDPRDKKSYKTVKIGKQTWMAENLNFADEGSKCGGTVVQTEESEYEDGEMISYYLLEDENTKNCDTYGRLYYYPAKTACPAGWHLSSDAEWDILIKTVGDSSTAGTKLKAKNGWNKSSGKSGNGTDNYGFSALPGGETYYARYGGAGNSGGWWSVAENDDGASNVRRIWSSDGDVKTNLYPYGFLFSIRCVQD